MFICVFDEKLCGIGGTIMEALTNCQQSENYLGNRSNLIAEDCEFYLIKKVKIKVEYTFEPE
jgi:hypothetical protein